MKRSIFIFIGLMLLTAFSAAQPTTPEERQLRDSIFKVSRSIDQPGNQIDYLRNMFLTNIEKEWIVELLDSALAISVKSKNSDAELILRINYYHHYKYSSNLPKMEEALQMLKEACNKYKTHKYYFQIWCDMLQFYNARGDTEHARMQALSMEEEAKQLKCEEGLAYAQLSMARTLAAVKKEHEAIELFRKALKSKAIKTMTKVIIHGEIVYTYQQIGKYKETIKELNIQKSILNKYIEEDSSRATKLKENLLEVELSYCTAYDKLQEKENLLAHLTEAQKYYTPDCFFSNYIAYHANWGAYYRITRQWDNCFREFDTALAHFDNAQPLYEMIILRMKGVALIEAGRYNDAAKLYKNLAIMGDSMNCDVMKLHQEALQANYHIRKAVLDKEALEKQYNWTIIGLVVVLLVILWLISYRANKIHRSLRHAERQTREALERVDAENKMKEVFLRNITHQIRGPLNVVVGFSEILAMEKDLSPEQTQEYSVSVKKNADLLFQLIIDVLDLSRLESGMMKFNLAECDAVQLCSDIKLSIEMQESNRVQLSFDTDVEALNIQADSTRFLQMLLSVLSAPDDCDTTIAVKYKLTKDNNQLKIVVANSPLLMRPDNIQRLKHDINRLFLTTFNGSYQIFPKEEQSLIIITYPLE